MATKEFDPTEFGAISDQEFDPLAHGAIRINGNGEISQPSGLFPRLSSAFRSSVEQRRQQFQPALEAFGKGEQTLPETALQLTGQGFGVVGDVTSQFLPPIQGGLAGRAVEAIQTGTGGLFDKYRQLEQTNPRLFRNLQAIGNIGLAAPVVAGAGELAEAIPGGVKATGRFLTSQLEKQPTRLSSVAERQTEQAIEALAPELRGKKLVEAYKRGRGERIGVLRTQQLSPDEQTIQLAKNLSSVIKSTDPLENLESLGSEMNKTENKLTSVLKSDRTPIIKQAVKDELNGLKENMPREFKSIPTTRNAYNNAIRFGMDVVDKNEPNVFGLRNARIAFDREAEKEFPTAFKNGFIDTKTPAGKAIKDVRNALNNYIYNTAKEGSEIRNLIKREADIFRATSNIAPKASKLHGTTNVGRFFRRNPALKMVAEIGVRGSLLYEAGSLLGL